MIETLSDEELVVLIREEDKELYGEIIRRYEQKLTHYIRKFIRDPDELQDVLQEVFIRTFSNLHAFQVKKKFSSWIYRIAHNQAINHIKKYAKEVVSLDDGEWHIVDESFNIKDLIDQGLLKGTLEVALGEMKEKYREVLILSFFEQRTYEEISDILHIPINTVGTLLSRGKKQLRTSLEHTVYGKQ